MYLSKYLKYKNKYKNLIKCVLGCNELTPYHFFIYSKKHKIINELFYLCNVNSIVQINNKKLITIIEKSNYLNNECGCLSLNIYLNILVYFYENINIFIDCQLNFSHILSTAEKINRKQNFYVVNTYDIFSSIFNTPFNNIIILSSPSNVENILNSVKHLNITFNSKINNSSIKITNLIIN